MSERKHSGKSSKTKGRGFESEVARLFTNWAGSQFRRVPLSGGWQGGVVTGDIFLVAEYLASCAFGGPRPRFPFSLECKKQESWDFAQLFKGDTNCPLFTWWEQTKRGAKVTGKLPALVFTRNYLPIFVMVDCSTVVRINELVHSSWENLSHVTCCSSSDCCVVIFLLSDFLSWVPFETLLKIFD
jgi:hypothetical protein